MEFQDTLNNNFNVELFISAGIMAVVVLGLFAIYVLATFTSDFYYDNKKKPAMITFLGIFVVIGITILTTQYLIGAKNEVKSNSVSLSDVRESLKENIMLKYNIDDVKFEGRNVLTDEEYYLSASTAEEQLAIITVDDNDYFFSLTQNPETFEPTLKNPPVNGGTTPTGISAESLLRDKTDN